MTAKTEPPPELRAIPLPELRGMPLPDLLAKIAADSRELVELQLGSLKDDLGGRLGQLGDAIRSWMIALCIALVTGMLFAFALAATATELAGVPWFASLWIVAAMALGCVAWLVLRARSGGRQATQGAARDVEQAIHPE